MTVKIRPELKVLSLPALHVFLLLMACAAPIIAGNDSLIDLDVRDADLRETFLDIARRADINLVIASQVSGKVTCRITRMEPVELILLLAQANGLRVQEHGRTIAILQENRSHGNILIEVISLQNADAAETAKIIQQLKMDKHAHITHDQRTNRLIVAYEY